MTTESVGRAGGWVVGRPATLSLLPDAMLTATAVAIPTAATAPPPMSSIRRLFCRVSEASASAAQSGVRLSLPLFHDC
ncbi:hypothetical protein GCM10009564_24950 [Streptomyces thermogriseus]|uniref:Uncharacterized protein n=1 Tax=Streptomyces thermogriseus TaxID=75292 RepID=A0ABN1SYW9_9ACTN